MLRSCEELSDYVSYEDDELLEQLEDLHVEWDVDEKDKEGESEEERLRRAQGFTIEFGFKKGNGFISDEGLVLRKSFRFVSKPGGGSGAGVTEKYVSEPTKIDWVSRKRDLTRPSSSNGQGTTNSFFDWFRFTGTGPGDYANGEGVALTLAEVVFPHAEKLFVEGLNEENDEEEGLEEEYDLESEEEEEDEEAEHEDAPPKKKTKV